MISCSDYDYIEIVCMFRYPVVLTLKSGDKVQGTAIDTVRNDNKEECVLLETMNGASHVLLDSIVQLEVSVDNPHFFLFPYFFRGSSFGVNVNALDS